MSKTLENFGMFDYKADDEDLYQYTSAEWSKFCQGIVGNGVSRNIGNKFNLTLNGLSATVDTGYAFINGRWGYNEAAATLTMDAQSSTTYYTIYLKMDIPGRLITLECDTGKLTTSSNTNDVKIMPLYYIKVSGSTATLDTDCRTFTYDSVNTVNEMNTRLEAAISENKSYVDNHTYTLANISGITTGSTEPTNPSVGDIWLYYEASY